MAELQLEYVQENIAAMKELLNWYESGKREPVDCPLCIASDDNCDICPWTLLADVTCTYLSDGPTVVGYRVARDSDWTARRIPELKEWITIYETWEKSHD